MRSAHSLLQFIELGINIQKVKLKINHEKIFKQYPFIKDTIDFIIFKK